jgi:hypothetical protein
VKTFLAVILGAVLIQCEWKDTYLKVFADNGCCQVTCCIPEPGDQQEENPRSDQGLVKPCCSSCCYIGSESIGLIFYPAGLDIFFEESDDLNSFFISDCFHPPEFV